MIENPPAFPVVCENGLGHVSEGMDLRDWFAGQIINGLLASGKWDNCGAGFEAYIATHAANIADAMLAERSKPGVQS
jgi:hypothetical protein